MRIDLGAQKSHPPASAADLSGLLGGQAPSGAVITELPLDKLTPYPNQPFRAYTPERLAVLAEDIRINGVLSPIIVRPKGEMFEILAGHNRWAASRLADRETIPAIVQYADDDTAALIMVNTNLNQRDQLLPSEKAFAYKVQLEAMKRQGQKADVTCGQVVHKSRDAIGEEHGESGRQIQRYIRLTCLIPDLLEQVDNNELSMIPAVALSYLPPDEQEMVLRVSADCERKVSVFQAETLKRAVGQLTEEYVAEILLPHRRWNAQQEFVNRSRVLIPTSASEDDVEEVLVLVSEFFENRMEAK